MRIKLLAIGLLLIIFVSCLYYAYIVNQSEFKVVFCDVGQGDATLFVYKDFQLLVDVGPNDSILNCLDSHMLFDKQIEFLVVTHADKDHFAGLLSVLDYYEVENISIFPSEKDTPEFQALYSELKELETYGGVELHTLFAGDGMRYGDLQVSVLWPTRDFVRRQPFLSSSTQDFDFNLISVVLHVSFAGVDVLVNADADSRVQNAMLLTGLVPSSVEIMTAPHHGSRTGMFERWLAHVRPMITVVSSGVGNSYGHPSPDVLEVLSSNGTVVYRTDTVGSVVFTLKDGKLMYQER